MTAVVLAIVLGLAAGVLAGMFGVGGGVVFVHDFASFSVAARNTWAARSMRSRSAWKSAALLAGVPPVTLYSSRARCDLLQIIRRKDSLSVARPHRVKSAWASGTDGFVHKTFSVSSSFRRGCE